MDIFEALYNRRSIRKYTSQLISREDINLILKAGMYAPSAYNYQPWQFWVIEDKALLSRIQKETIAHADMLNVAAAAIVVCGDRKLDNDIEYLVQNCSAVTQNIMLASHALGIGSCWIGCYPAKETMDGLKKILSLPDEIVPFSLIAMGYPAESIEKEERFKPEKIHWNSR